MQGEGDGSWSGMPGDGQSLSHQLLHLLLVRTGVEGKGFLQRSRTSLLRRRLFGGFDIGLVDVAMLIGTFYLDSIRASSKRLRNATFVVI